MFRVIGTEATYNEGIVIVNIIPSSSSVICQNKDFIEKHCRIIELSVISISFNYNRNPKFNHT